MKTTLTSSSILWSCFGSIVKLTKVACPRLFLHTNKGIRTHKPTSFAAHPKKTDILIVAPNYNRYAHTLPHHQAQELWAMFFALQSDFAKGTAAITSDGMLVIYDFGCTCAITFDKSNFIGPI